MDLAVDRRGLLERLRLRDRGRRPTRRGFPARRGPERLPLRGRRGDGLAEGRRRRGPTHVAACRPGPGPRARRLRRWSARWWGPRSWGPGGVRRGPRAWGGLPRRRWRRRSRPPALFPPRRLPLVRGRRLALVRARRARHGPGRALALVRPGDARHVPAWPVVARSEAHLRRLFGGLSGGCQGVARGSPSVGVALAAPQRPALASLVSQLLEHTSAPLTEAIGTGGRKVVFVLREAGRAGRGMQPGVSSRRGNSCAVGVPRAASQRWWPQSWSCRSAPQRRQRRHKPSQVLSPL